MTFCNEFHYIDLYGIHLHLMKAKKDYINKEQLFLGISLKRLGIILSGFITTDMFLLSAHYLPYKVALQNGCWKFKINFNETTPHTIISSYT